MDTIPARRFHYLGRRLLWDEYKELVYDPLEFDSSFLFETLEVPHDHFVRECSQHIKHVELSYPTPNEAFTHPLLEQPLPVWLIVHSANKEELALLLDHARDRASIAQASPLFVVLSSQEMHEPGVHWLGDQHPIDWYPRVQRIISACGFNSWHQLKPWRTKHIALPLKRRFDDQFWRSGLL